MEKISKVISIIGGLLLIFSCQTWGSINCNRTLVGQSGVVSSYNFPFDYDNHLRCTYTHQFNEFPRDEDKEICFQFTRFHTESHLLYDYTDYLEIQGRKFHGRGYDYMANICFPVYDNLFTMKFVSNRGKKESGFYAMYYVTSMSDVVSVPLFKENVSETTKYVQASSAFCSTDNMFTCFDGKGCILKSKVCDSSMDCQDGSDEAYATADPRCSRNAFGQLSVFRAVDFHLYRYLDDYRMSVLRGSWEVKTYDASDGNYGPKNPHRAGSFIQTDFALSGVTTTATVAYYINDDLYKDNITYCLTFWYHMYGKDSGRLDVIWGKANGQAIWTRVGNLQNQWYKGEVQRVPTNSDMAQILFNVTRAGTTRTKIALDDISLMPGPCHQNTDYELADDLSCTFEDGMCRWSSETDWIVTDGSNNPTVPPGAAQGKFYLAPNLLSSPNTLVSPMVTVPQNPRCIIFSAYSWITDKITMYLRYQDGHEWLQYSPTIAGKRTWQTFKYTIRTERPYQIVFRFNIGEVYFDDIALVDNFCSDLDLGTCEFDQYKCDASYGITDDCISKTLTCNGFKDCFYGDDEKYCQICKGETFHCNNDQCVPGDNRCDGYMQCSDGSDEAYCPSSSYHFGLPLEATVCIIIALCIILGLISVKAVSCLYQRKERRARDQLNALRRSVSGQSGQEDGLPAEFYTVPPPEYNDAVNNPAFPRPGFVPFGVSALHDDKEDLPSYEVVSAGNFVQITIPVEEEVEKMKRQMASRTQPSESSAASLDNHSMTSAASSSSYSGASSFFEDDQHSISTTMTGASGNDSYSNPAYEPNESST